MKYIKLMRVPHWIKNLLVFLPLIFGGRLTHAPALFRTMTACISFCCASSAVYCVNDILDVEKDRLHAKKCRRPIASGAVSIRSAWICSGVLLAASVGINFCVAGMDGSIWLVWGSYLVINGLYSVFRWKDKALLDIVLLVSGFFLRVLYGAVVTGISISSWLYLVVISGAFYMGFGKRRNELMQSGEMTRKVLGVYNKNYLDGNMSICMTLSITFYALWCLEKGEHLLKMSNLLVTVPVLMLIFFRYGLDLENGSGGDPVEVILHDRVLLTLGAMLGIALLLILYGGNAG